MEYQPSTFYGDKTGNLRVERRCSVDKGRHRRGQLRTRLPVLFPPHFFFSLFLLRILEEGGSGVGGGGRTRVVFSVVCESRGFDRSRRPVPPPLCPASQGPRPAPSRSPSLRMSFGLTVKLAVYFRVKQKVVRLGGE